ncbi:MAG: glycosyltransferase [Pseudomonadota bacterium]
MSFEIPIPDKLIQEYTELFNEHSIPIQIKTKPSGNKAQNIIMVSTHGYWGDPPPAGVPDTGGQTYYVLEVSKAWAAMGRKVIIVARWFEPFPRVEKFAENVWLVRVRAHGDAFVRKEDIYRLVPEMAEATLAISHLFGADIAIGHYADGMVGALEVGERLEIPVIAFPHSLGARKVTMLERDLRDPETWLSKDYNFGIRESFELAALRGANLEIANTLAEPEMLKSFYNLSFPHVVMPAGVSHDFFELYDSPILSDFVLDHALEPRQYLIFWGRFSLVKNIQGVVSVLGELKKLANKLTKRYKVLIIGGTPNRETPMEQKVAENIEAARSKYKLSPEDIVTMPNLEHKDIALFAKFALCYVGMQEMEPFGMGAAEAMGVGLPVVISQAAGITQWIKDGKDGIIVNPHDPEAAAKKLLSFLTHEKKFNNISKNGYLLARKKFSWGGIAEDIAEFSDKLVCDKVPSIKSKGTKGKKQITARTGRAYHRLTFAWRGDPPIIKDHHKRAAEGLLPYVIEAHKSSKKRVTIAIGGESGSGKTEIAEYLRFLMRRENVWGVTLSGDAFFKLPPAQNHEQRMTAFTNNRLEQWIGPQEVDLKRLDETLAKALNKKTNLIFTPSDTRSLGSRRYENVPLDLTNAGVVTVDLTYALLLNNVAIKVFLERDYLEKLEDIKSRNLLRDPDQDFEFIKKVLQIEHEIISPLREKANLIVTKDYDVKKSA